MHSLAFLTSFRDVTSINRCPTNTIIKLALDPNNSNNNKNENNNDEDLSEKLNSFLDKPIFDPNNPSNEENWFANMVKNDYESAEALYVGAFFFVMVVVSQELLRMVKYGDLYVPFGSGGGKLF